MFISCQKYNLYLLCSSVPLRNSTTCSIFNCQNPNEHHSILRQPNSKSTAYLLHHLSHKDDGAPIPIPIPKPSELQDPMPHEEKVKVLELSLVRKRSPQFPGSIYAQSPSDSDVGSSLPPLRTLFQSSDGKDNEEEEEEMIMRALEIRRKVTEEVFKEAVRKGKFGITYTTNLVTRLSGFIDYIMIEAANLKRLPEFSNSTFNLRAKIVIDDSKVVPLIRWLKHNAISFPRIAKLILMSRGNLEAVRSFVEWLKSVYVKGEFLGVVMVNAGDNIFQRSHAELDEIVLYLESNGVRRDWMEYVISRCPQLLSYSLDEVKTRAQIYHDMGLNEKDFGTMVFDFPKVLGYYSMEEMNAKMTIVPKVIFLMTKAGVSEKDIAKVVALGPELLGCNIAHKLDVNVKYFLCLGIRLRQLGEMIADFPMLLRYNPDVLRPNYSLEGRIIPRHKVLVENQINIKLRYIMLTSTDEEFNKMVKGIIRKRLRFESAVTNEDTT
ncbi:hypothetical protein JHK82_030732 [Glycine max]|nr:hypothetical protein JHK85_031374 [Glycine max]KAG5123995.1 hypothetical protein JHK82_030732 [Glycine max]KAG5145412.1 hypothetical protein JHK84_030955 [Glycine max]